jgi:hypothetical protein
MGANTLSWSSALVVPRWKMCVCQALQSGPAGTLAVWQHDPLPAQCECVCVWGVWLQLLGVDPLVAPQAA